MPASDGPLVLRSGVNELRYSSVYSYRTVAGSGVLSRHAYGLAIDVFNTMREFGAVSQDPMLEFCEDWMLADEVTHVKMGSDWLRRVTEHDPDRLVVVACGGVVLSPGTFIFSMEPKVTVPSDAIDETG